MPWMELPREVLYTTNHYLSTNNAAHLQPVLWIRIRVGSVSRSFVDPDPYSEYGTGSTTLFATQNLRQIKYRYLPPLSGWSDLERGQVGSSRAAGAYRPLPFFMALLMSPTVWFLVGPRTRLIIPPSIGRFLTVKII